MSAKDAPIAVRRTQPTLIGVLDIWRVRSEFIKNQAGLYYRTCGPGAEPWEALRYGAEQWEVRQK